MSKKSDFMDLGEVDAKTLGNFTKNAVEQFENNIVNQTDYLEKTKEITSREEKTEKGNFS